MQSSNDRAVRERKLLIPVGLDRYIVAQEGTYTVEAACFMGRGDQSPVAVTVRDLGNEGRGGILMCLSGRVDNVGESASQRCNCNHEECEVFHKSSSIQMCLGNLKSAVLTILP